MVLIPAATKEDGWPRGRYSVIAAREGSWYLLLKHMCDSAGPEVGRFFLSPGIRAGRFDDPARGDRFHEPVHVPGPVLAGSATRDSVRFLAGPRERENQFFRRRVARLRPAVRDGCEPHAGFVA
jgi:hypothetical protein